MKRPPDRRKDDGPGVPEAVPRTLQRIGARFDPGTLDRIWIFPPMINGRRERGLVTASHRAPGEEDGDRRTLVAASYFAERTGKGLTLEVSIDEPGVAPPDRFPRVMQGVVNRAGEDFGDAREVELDFDGARFLELLEEFEDSLLDPDLPPRSTGVEEPSGAGTAAAVPTPDAASPSSESEPSPDPTDAEPETEVVR